MAELILERGEDGKLHGLDDTDQRAYNRFISAIKALATGQTVHFAFWLPRSPGFHRRHFKILSAMYAIQDQFEDRDAFRMWVQVGAGFCDLLPGPHGKPVAIPRSIKWHKLEESDFAEHHAKVIAFFRSVYFTRFLWPGLPDVKADEMVNTVLMEFDA